MSTKLSEIDALKVIDEALADLKVEEKNRIFSFLASKHSLVYTNNSNPNPGGNKNKDGAITPDGQPTKDIKQFIAAKKPVGFYEQIACLGYYLEKVELLESFDTKAISNANTTARATKIPNPSLYLGDVVSKYGYLTAIGGGKKAMTARGEALVEALPDREAVKQALENNPVKKKGAKKKKAKK